MAPPINNFAPDTSLALLKAQQGQAANFDPKKLAQTQETATEFEAMMLSEMLKQMFEGIEVDDQFGGGKGEEVFRGFMIQEYGKIMARAGGIGIADTVKQHLIEMQGGSTNTISQNDIIDVTGEELNANAAAE